MLSSRGNLRLSIAQIRAPAPRDVCGLASLGTSPGSASHPAWLHFTPCWGSDGMGTRLPRDSRSDAPRAQDGWPGGDEHSWGHGTVSPCKVPNPHMAKCFLGASRGMGRGDGIHPCRGCWDPSLPPIPKRGRGRRTACPCAHYPEGLTPAIIAPTEPGVMQEQVPMSPEHLKVAQKDLGMGWSAGRSPQGSREDMGSQATPGLVPLCQLPIEHPGTSTVQPLRPQRLPLLPADGFGSAASPPSASTSGL